MVEPARRRFQHKCVRACEQGWVLQKFSSEPEQLAWYIIHLRYIDAGTFHLSEL
jgi:hypothetical protein